MFQERAFSKGLLKLLERVNCELIPIPTQGGKSILNKDDTRLTQKTFFLSVEEP